MEKLKANFIKYEKVRLSGKYNMIMDCGKAAKEAGLTMKEYTDIVKRYSIVKELVKEG